MANPNALIVDDEPDIRELLELTLMRMDIDTRTAADLTEARTLLGKHSFDLCLTDMRLPDGNGIELVEHVQEHYPHIPIAVITAHGNMESAIHALKAGAFDFVSKPVDLKMLRNLVGTALKLAKPQSGGTVTSSRTLIGNSKAIERLRATTAKLARSQAPVYISGESGTGKELVARMIHESGPRADKPFVPVNCGAIPADLMESEFFGHKRGSFTGAVADKEGLFQTANGGTLFLDEVAELPLHMQVKLLRSIQEKAIRPVGAQKEIPIDVRILSATHKDLAALVAEGSFRQDLYYRINVIEMRAPPLREHPEDIPILAEHILGKLSGQFGGPMPTLSDDAMEALKRYHFPGNVREMENILERALTLCEGDSIGVEDLHLPDNELNPDDFLQEDMEAGLTPAAPPEDLPAFLDNIEKQAIVKALEETRYNKTAAAKRLGITFRALRYRLKKLGLE